MTSEKPTQDADDLESVRAVLDEAVPTEHWRNVGRVAVHAAWLEESAALILYASRGGWDMSYEHLGLATSKVELFASLKDLLRDLPEAGPRDAVDAQGQGRQVKSEAGELADFIESASGLLARRDRVVHSVPWYDFFAETIEFIHPRSIEAGADNARTSLPSSEVCEQLVRELVLAARHGQKIAPRIGARMTGR